MFGIRAERILCLVNQQQPVLSSAEKKLMQDMAEFKDKLTRYQKELEQVKAKQNYHKIQVRDITSISVHISDLWWWCTFFFVSLDFSLHWLSNNEDTIISPSSQNSLPKFFTFSSLLLRWYHSCHFFFHLHFIPFLVYFSVSCSECSSEFCLYFSTEHLYTVFSVLYYFVFQYIYLYSLFPSYTVS